MDAFKAGKQDNENDACLVDQLLKTVPSNIELVCAVIEEDTRITYDEIKALNFLSRGSIFTITYDHLKMKKKINSHWVPHE